MLMRINNQSDRQTNYAIRIPILQEEEEKGLRRGGEKRQGSKQELRDINAG